MDTFTLRWLHLTIASGLPAAVEAGARFRAIAGPSAQRYFYGYRGQSMPPLPHRVWLCCRHREWKNMGVGARVVKRDSVISHCVRS